MIRTTIVAGALTCVAALTVPALAAAPSSAEECGKLSFDLAKKLAAKKLPEADAIKIDEMIVKVEGLCTEKKFSDAAATAKEVEAALKK